MPDAGYRAHGTATRLPAALLVVQPSTSQDVPPRCWSCLIATARVLELPSIGSSHAPKSCLCSGRNGSGQVALPLVVRTDSPRRLDRALPGSRITIGAEVNDLFCNDRHGALSAWRMQVPSSGTRSVTWRADSRRARGRRRGRRGRSLGGRYPRLLPRARSGFRGCLRRWPAACLRRMVDACFRPLAVVSCPRLARR